MNFSVVKYLNGFIVVDKNMRCKEEWVFQAYLLGLHKGSNPFLSFLKLLEADYKVEFFREFYTNDIYKHYEEPAGMCVVFSEKKDANAYAKKLNELVADYSI